MTGWTRHVLGDICNKVTVGHVGTTSPYYRSEGIQFLRTQNIGKSGLDLRDIKYVTEDFHNKLKKSRVKNGDILLSRVVTDAVRCAIVPPDLGEANCANIILVRPGPKLNSQFLLYYIKSSSAQQFLLARRVGSAQSVVNTKIFKSWSILLPPLPEQKRIVAILDEAFAGIDAAVANTEKNLANARELFESYLNALSFAKQPMGSLVKVKTGKLNANAAVKGGEYPFFTCSREVYEIDHYGFDCEAILLAGNNASGDFNVKHYSGKFNAYQRTYIITINDTEKLRYRFLYFQLLKSLKELKSSSVGAGTKFLKLGMIKDLQIFLPPIKEQRSVLETLEELLSESERLQVIYQQKLTALAELKQSILQKAFAGELTTLPEKAVEEAIA